MEPDIIEPIPGKGNFGGLAPLITTPIPVFSTLRAESVRQQLLTNCPLPAILAAMAHAIPERLRAMVQRVEHQQPRTAWFEGSDKPANGEYLETKTTFKIAFQRKTIEITPFIYSDPHYQPRFAKAADGAGWVSYIEKAYVAYRAKYIYKNLDFFGQDVKPLTVERIIEDIAIDFDALGLSEHRKYYDLEPHTLDPAADNLDKFDTADYKDLSNKNTIRYLKTMLRNAGKRATVASTHNHVRAVLGYKNGKVKLHDAMGHLLNHTYDMKLRDFLHSHSDVYQVRN